MKSQTLAADISEKAILKDGAVTQKPDATLKGQKKKIAGTNCASISFDTSSLSFFGRAWTGEAYKLPLKITNCGTLTWPANGPFKLSYHWLQGRTTVVATGLKTPMPQAVAPGQSVTLQASVQAPASEGDYTLRFDMLQEGGAWFSAQGNGTLGLEIHVGQRGDLAVTDLTAALVPKAPLPPGAIGKYVGGDYVKVSAVIKNNSGVLLVGKKIELFEGNVQQPVGTSTMNFAPNQIVTVNFTVQVSHSSDEGSYQHKFKVIVGGPLPTMKQSGLPGHLDRLHTREIVMSSTVPGNGVWDTYLPNNEREIIVSERALHQMAFKGDAVISDMKATLLKENANVEVSIKVTNKCPDTVNGLRLRLLKNNVIVKEWWPIDLRPGGETFMVYPEAFPGWGTENQYVARLANDTNKSKMEIDTRSVTFKMPKGLTGH